VRYKPLGNSGLLISELALGTMIFGEQSERGAAPEQAERIIHRYIDAGGNHIDTADVYASGRSEQIIGQALQGKREQVILATKLRFALQEGVNEQGLSRYHLMRGVEGSLRRLQTDVIDLLYVHAWDPLTPLEETLRALDDLVAAGKVRYLGVSNFKAWQLMKALSISDRQGWARFIAAQNQYSLVVRDIEQEFIDLCAAEGLGLVPWGPLGGGFLSGKYRTGQRPEDPAEGRLAITPDKDEEAWDRRANERNWRILEEIERVLAAHPGATHSQVALAWLLTRPAVASVILGVRTMAQLEDNLAAADLALSAEQIASLDRVSTPAIGYPYRYLGIYGTRPEVSSE
jgi:aryl-alcohol dehydrogenase-like predicted oxidoreductase